MEATKLAWADAKDIAEDIVLDLIENLVEMHGAEDAGRILKAVVHEGRDTLRNWSDITEMLS